MGSDITGRKEVIGLTDGYRESEASWLELLEQLSEQGFTVPPEVAVGDCFRVLESHYQTLASDQTPTLLGAQDRQRIKQIAQGHTA